MSEPTDDVAPVSLMTSGINSGVRLASSLPAAVIRANFLLYLVALDLLLFVLLTLLGMMNWSIVVLGLLVGIPNLIANVVGARLFDPAAERVFRNVAYLVIAASAIVGLPLWKG